MGDKETILCVTSDTLLQAGIREGVTPIQEVNTKKLFAPENVWFLPRSVAEKRPDFKQIIPYVVLLKRVQGTKAYGVYQRSKKAGEVRLHSKWSLGFGGHVNIQDAKLKSAEVIDVYDTICFSSERELEEEVGITAPLEETVHGVIYDSSSEVSSVHLGIVLLWDITDISVGEVSSEMWNLRFLDFSAIKELEDLEDWSKLVLTELISKGKL